MSILSTITGAQISVIMVGGALGAVSRYIVSGTIMDRLGSDFPYGTLTVNVLGSFLMGFLAMFLVERMGLDPLVRLGIFVGFLGAFTTFSTFSMETLNLLEQDAYLKAFTNMFISVLLSVVAVWLGVIVGKTVG